MPRHTIWNQIRRFLGYSLSLGIWCYYTILFGWMTAYVVFGDRGFLALVNAMALYLFIPLPLVAVVLLRLKRPKLWRGVFLGGLIFMTFWGRLFLPKFAQPFDNGPTLTVMTFNTLVHNRDVSASLVIIKNENPDVIFLQEVNQEMSEGMRVELGEIYPYQIVNTTPGVSGMAIFSKTPLHLDDEELPLRWIGKPQVAWLSWEGEEIGIVNFHMVAPGLASSGDISWNFRYREGQAEGLVDYAILMDVPIIAGGDANLTSLSGGYKIITRVLRDSWQEAGYGFGHTFPGSSINGSARPRWGPFSVPQWLVRIDYIFVSDEWIVVDARMAEFDGVSDHRGVVVELALAGGR